MIFDTYTEQNESSTTSAQHKAIISLIADKKIPKIICEQSRINILFRLKRELLELAHDDFYDNATEFRKAIFDHRNTIARLFGSFGGKLHEENESLFLNLNTPDDLIKLAIEPKNPKKARDYFFSKDYVAPGFYVFGRIKLNKEQEIALKNVNPLQIKGKKGNEIPIKEVSNLYRTSNDNRPIYINASMDAKLIYLLKLYARLRPECVERTFHVEWTREGLKIKSLSDILSELPQKNETEQIIENKLVIAAKKFFLSNPKKGEVYLATVDTVSDDFLFVELAPGIYSIVKSKNKLMSVKNNQEEIPKDGDTLLVKVEQAEAESFQDGNEFIKCMKYTAILADKNEEPCIAETERNILLSLLNVL